MMQRALCMGIIFLASGWGQVTPSQDPMDRGISLLKAGQYSDAAVILQSVVDREPSNQKALWGLISAKFLSIGMVPDTYEKNRRIEETERLVQQVLALHPNDEDAYYTLGVLAWSKAYPQLQSARERIGMKAQDPGPLTDFSVRQEMRGLWEPVIEEGIGDLRKSIQLDPLRSDSMAYMNLLLRSRADIRDTPELAADDLRQANAWVEKAIAAKAAGTDPGRVNQFYIGPPPPPPPPPVNGRPAPNAIRIGGNVAAANLVTKVDPVYPPLARQARIQGTVKFNTVIGKDGHVTNLALVSGHPLLVAAAQQAAQQWVYRPTLLNGQPVEVITTTDVTFVLAQ